MNKDFYFYNEYEIRALEMLSKKLNVSTEKLINDLISNSSKETVRRRINVKLNNSSLEALKGAGSGSAVLRTALMQALNENDILILNE